jgi:hypothetical protein
MSIATQIFLALIRCFLGTLLIYLAFKTSGITISQSSLFLLVFGVFLISHQLEQRASASPLAALPVPSNPPNEPTPIPPRNFTAKRF